jgi:hypothetical protein
MVFMMVSVRSPAGCSKLSWPPSARVCFHPGGSSTAIGTASISASSFGSFGRAAPRVQREQAAPAEEQRHPAGRAVLRDGEAARAEPAAHGQVGRVTDQVHAQVVRDHAGEHPERHRARHRGDVPVHPGHEPVRRADDQVALLVAEGRPAHLAARQLDGQAG